MSAIQIEIASRGISCLDYFSKERIESAKTQANRLFAHKQREQQAKEQREREQRDARIVERKAERKRVSEQNQANARNSVSLVGSGYQTYYGRNNERKRRTICYYLDGSLITTSQSDCPFIQ